MQRLLILMILSLLTHISHAQIEINVSGGNVRGIPVAVVPFKVADDLLLEFDIAEIIKADLVASGRFEVVDTRHFLSMPFKDDQVLFKEWRLIEAEVLVIGEISSQSKKNYTLVFHAYDVARQKKIGQGVRITLPSQQLRRAAHIISDHVYEHFNGSAQFDSRIAYVTKTGEKRAERFSLMIADWDGYNPREIYRSVNPILSPDWSPDARKLAFVSFTRRGSIVQAYDINKRRVSVIASSPGVNAAPAWSPDGMKIAYSSSAGGNSEIYYLDLQTRERIQVTSHGAIDTEPAWSADGKFLYFTSNRNGKPQIYRSNLQGSDIARRITFEGMESANASIDSSGREMLLVHNGGSIAIMNLATEKMRFISVATFDESPSFSPSSDMILYASEQGGMPAFFVSSSDGRVRTKLTILGDSIREPAWSPLNQ